MSTRGSVSPNREGILLVGGGRALLLQLADPAIAEGVARHSGFALDPVRRLTGTLEYLYVLAFGSDDEQRRIARLVGDAHRGVRGAGDRPYDARDPALQLWVAATLYDTTVLIVEAVRGPLSAADGDALYRQSARNGTALGMPPALWPADRAAFAAYWADRIAHLEVTPTARILARTLMRPAHGPRWVRWSMPLVRLLTAGFLPERIRAGYGVRWSPALQRRFERRFRVLTTTYRLLPAAVRQAPSLLVLRRFRARTGSVAAPAAP